MLWEPSSTTAQIVIESLREASLEGGTLRFMSAGNAKPATATIVAVTGARIVRRRKDTKWAKSE